MRIIAVCFYLFVFNASLLAQKTGIKGYVTDEKGNAVPFVSIGIEKESGGTLANEAGEYRMPLNPGRHTVIFQCLGYKTERKEVEVSEGFQNVPVVMTEQILQTKEVLVAPGNEDPAYPIMRKAIARARINRMLVNSYKAEAYIRGSGRLLDVPMLMKPFLKKEGIDPNTVFFKESLEEIEFRQPNSYVEKVKASRSNFGKFEARQSLVKYELYSPRLGETVSPLSPSAFRYYRFEYLGAFTDFRHEIYKIKVIPRRPGESIWSGEISIVNGLWCIHSADLAEEDEGIKIRIKQEYTPIEDIWLPTHIRFDSKGGAYWIEFEATYNAVIRKYQLVKNAALFSDYKKLEQKLDENTDEIIRANPQKPDLKKKEKEDRKMMQQLAKNYAKERLLKRKKENKERNIPASVVSNRVFIEDSSSINNDTVFWKENRLVPLTQSEERSFVKMDSIYKKEAKKDSAGKWKKVFSPVISILATGKNFSLGKPDSLSRKPMELKVFSPLHSFGLNAVEGYHLQQGIWFKKYFGQSTRRFNDDRSYIQFGPDIRYSFGRKKLLGSGVFQYSQKSWTVQLSGGSAMRQLAQEPPAILPSTNWFYAEFTGKNFIKVYQADFFRLDFLRKLTGRLETEAGIGLENRRILPNTVFRSITGKEFRFEPNGIGIPPSPGLDSMPDPGRMFSLRLAFTWYPTMTSGMYNGNQYFRIGNGPAIRLELLHAIPGIGNARADFTRADLSLTESMEVARGTNLEVFARAAAFLRKGFAAPMDALHVQGNQTSFIDGNSLSQFRNLPYYARSNGSGIAEVHTRFYRDKLIFGWLFPNRKLWREGLLFNALVSPGKPVFREYGYALDKIFGFLHLEAVASGNLKEKQQWRFMAGVSYNLNASPKTLDR